MRHLRRRRASIAIPAKVFYEVNSIYRRQCAKQKRTTGPVTTVTTNRSPFTTKKCGMNPRGNRREGTKIERRSHCLPIFSPFSPVLACFTSSSFNSRCYLSHRLYPAVSCGHPRCGNELPASFLTTITRIGSKQITAYGTEADGQTKLARQSVSDQSTTKK